MIKNTCPAGFVKGVEGKNDLQLAKKFGVSPITIRNWKKRLGLPPAPVIRVDYTQIEAMLREQVKPTDIAKATGYSESAIKRRRREMFGSRCRTPPRPRRSEESASEHPRESRENLAMRVKADVMGVDRVTFLAWMKTPKGQAWRAQMNFTGGKDDHNSQSVCRSTGSCAKTGGDPDQLLGAGGPCHSRE